MQSPICNLASARKKNRRRSARFFFLLCSTSGFLLWSDTPSASTSRMMSTAYPRMTPTPTPIAQNPTRPPIPDGRLQVVAGETKEVPFASGADSVLVTAPEILTVEIRGRTRLSLTGLKTGEALLIIFSGSHRHTIVVEITKRPTVSERNVVAEQTAVESSHRKTSGSFTANYTHSTDDGPSALRQTLSMTSKLSSDRTLRISAETTKTFKNGDGSGLAVIEDFGLNRLSAGLDTPNRTIDFLDSNVEVSPLTLNNYTIRGFHLTSRANPVSNQAVQKKGFEVFAGLARPTLAFFDRDQGKVVGAMVPISSGDNWRLRAGFVSVASDKNARANSVGNAIMVEGAYAPTRNLVLDGEAQVTNGSVSWRARAELRLPKYGAFGEIKRLASDSPFISIGAQPGGTKTETAGVYWRPASQLNLSANYNHARIERLFNSSLSSFDRSGFSAAASYVIAKGSRINFRFSSQTVETALGKGSARLSLETRNAVIGYNLRLSRDWSNSVDVRFNASREAGSSSSLEKGLSFSEQLRFSSRNHSITGFFNYNDRTPSLAGLLVRNPQLLPPTLEQAFRLDPTAFLQTYRDRMDTLLFGVELPQTRGAEFGARYQNHIGRFTINGEARYDSGEIFAANRKNLYTSLSVDIRLDNANSIRVSVWKLAGSDNRSGLTFLYTHVFGQNGGGFKFSKLLGLNRGRVEGRVYNDRNGNGQADPNEPGLAGVTVKLGGSRTTRTDAEGRYSFLANEGRYDVELDSDRLGVSLRASTLTKRPVAIAPNRTAEIGFGVVDAGFVAGRVFNDVDASGGVPSPADHGLAGVTVMLRGTEKTLTSITGPGGAYEFPNLRPGKYSFVLDPNTLPPNFNVPTRLQWDIVVSPIQGYYLDVPVSAQRAVYGIVYIDRNGDNRYDPKLDIGLEGALVIAGGVEARSNEHGAYMLRDLPAGRVTLFARLPDGRDGKVVELELSSDPVSKRDINLAVTQ